LNLGDFCRIYSVDTKSKRKYEENYEKFMLYAGQLYEKELTKSTKRNTII
jgi:hypothetical protein